MKQIYEFSLQEVCGFDDVAELVCHADIEEEGIECAISLSEDYSEQALDIPAQGTLHIYMTRGTVLVAGVKLSLALVSPKLIVPLFENADTWWPTDSPSTFSVLLNFETKECLSTVTEEETENSICFVNEECKHFEVLSKELADKNKALREKIFELEQSLSHAKWENQKQIRHLKHTHYEENSLAALLVDKLKYEANSYKVVKEDLENQCRGVETLFKQEKYQREHLEKQLQSLSEELEGILTGHKAREADLVSELTTKAEEVTHLKARIVALEEELRSVHRENSSLKETILIEEAHKLGTNSELHSRYQFLLDKFEDSERQRKLLYEQFETYRESNQTEIEAILRERESEGLRVFKEETNELKDQLTSQQRTIAELENKLEELELDTYMKQQDQQTDHSKQIMALNQKLLTKTKALDEVKAQTHEFHHKLQENKREIATLTDQVKHLSKKLETAAKESFEWRRKYKEAEEANSALSQLTQQAKHAADERVKRQQEKYEQLIRELRDKEEQLRSELRLEAKRDSRMRPERHKPEPVDEAPKRETNKQWSDNADERFNEYLRTYGVENEFVRVAEGVYTFGSKKVSVSIKNGSLVCRVGGGYMMIDEFLRLFIKREADPLSPKNETAVESDEEIVYEYASHPMNGFKENKEVSPTKSRVPKNLFKSFKPIRQSRDWTTTPVKKSGSGRRLSQGIL